jgi:hypothetical protein
MTEEKSNKKLVICYRCKKPTKKLVMFTTTTRYCPCEDQPAEQPADKPYDKDLCDLSLDLYEYVTLGDHRLNGNYYCHIWCSPDFVDMSKLYTVAIMRGMLMIEEYRSISSSFIPVYPGVTHWVPFEHIGKCLFKFI